MSASATWSSCPSTPPTCADIGIGGAGTGNCAVEGPTRRDSRHAAQPPQVGTTSGQGHSDEVDPQRLRLQQTPGASKPIQLVVCEILGGIRATERGLDFDDDGRCPHDGDKIDLAAGDPKVAGADGNTAPFEESTGERLAETSDVVAG